MEVLRSTAESLFHERQESMKRPSSKEIDSNGMSTDGNDNSDSSNLAYSTNSVNRYPLS